MAEAISTSVESVEQWRSIVGLEGRYDVSDQGRVRSLVKVTRCRVKARTTPLILKYAATANGYLRVRIYREPQRYHQEMVHCLVAAAFLGPKPEGLQVNHIDGVKTNNRLSNLEYLTRSENVKHAIRLGLSQAPAIRLGEQHHKTTLNENAVREIRHLASQGIPHSQIATQFNISATSVYGITNRKRWAHVV